MTIPFECARCASRHTAICRVMSDVELEQLNRISTRKHIRQGHLAFPQNEPLNHFAIVVSGVIKLVRSVSNDGEQIVGLVFPSDFFGLWAGNQNPYVAKAVSDVELCCLSRSEFETVLREHPRLYRLLLRHVLTEIDDYREWVLSLCGKDAEARVASFIYMIAERAFQAGWAKSVDINSLTFNLPLSRSEIANYLGLTKETISRKVTQLKERRIIKVKRSKEIFIPNLKKLQEISSL